MSLKRTPRSRAIGKATREGDADRGLLKAPREGSLASRGTPALVAKITPANIPSGDSWGAPVGKEVW
jgi:hypothetical protein